MRSLRTGASVGFIGSNPPPAYNSVDCTWCASAAKSQPPGIRLRHHGCRRYCRALLSNVCGSAPGVSGVPADNFTPAPMMALLAQASCPAASAGATRLWPGGPTVIALIEQRRFRSRGFCYRACHPYGVLGRPRAGEAPPSETAVVQRSHWVARFRRPSSSPVFHRQSAGITHPVSRSAVTASSLATRRGAPPNRCRLLPPAPAPIGLSARPAGSDELLPVRSPCAYRRTQRGIHRARGRAPRHRLRCGANRTVPMLVESGRR